MRKKIIFVFIFSLMAMFLLTGCGITIQGEKITDFENVATQVSENKGYTLPDGYKVAFAEPNSNSRIVIKQDYISMYFDVSKEEVKLEKMVINMGPWGVMLMVTPALFFVIWYIKKEKSK